MDGLIWVMDSSDIRRLEDCKAELHNLLKEEIHTKERNRLSSSKLSQLIYIQLNARLIGKRKNKDGYVTLEDSLISPLAHTARHWLKSNIVEDYNNSDSEVIIDDELDSTTSDEETPFVTEDDFDFELNILGSASHSD